MGVMKPVKSYKPQHVKKPQRFAGNWPTRSKAVSSKVRTYNLRDEMNLPATTESE